jgi:Inner membrane component of T3SS, cytoplasmic domain
MRGDLNASAAAAAGKHADQQPLDLALRVLKGRHQGAITPLGASDILVIGSSDDCDVILADPGVAGHHCGATLQDTRLVLRAIEGDLTLNGRQYGPGTTVQLGPRAAFGLGDAVLAMVETQPSERVPLLSDAIPVKLLRRYRWGIGAALAVLVGVAFALNPESFGMRPKPAASAIDPAPLAAQRPGAIVALDVAEVLRLSGIASEARYSGDGVVTVRGHLGDPQALAAVVRSRAMREIAGLKRVEVFNLDTGKPAAPVPVEPARIVSVVAGGTPYVVTEDGSRYYVGASLPDGGKLSGVMTRENGSAEVLVMRDGRIDRMQLARAGSRTTRRNSMEE